MDETGVYARQGFGRPTGLGRSPALLVVDFVNGFVDPEILGGGNVAEAVAAAAPLLAGFRARDLPVIFTRIVLPRTGRTRACGARRRPGCAG